MLRTERDGKREYQWEQSFGRTEVEEKEQKLTASRGLPLESYQGGRPSEVRTMLKMMESQNQKMKRRRGSQLKKECRLESWKVVLVPSYFLGVVDRCFVPPFGMR